MPEVQNEASTGNVIKNPNFKSSGDFINVVLSEHCVEITGAQPEIKNDKGEVTQKAKSGHKAVSIDRLKALATLNNIEIKRSYPNIGMYRMNIGNMLRVRARKTHGMYVPKGEFDGHQWPDRTWMDAPEDFAVKGERGQPILDREGQPIAKAKAKAKDESEKPKSARNAKKK